MTTGRSDRTSGQPPEDRPRYTEAEVLAYLAAVEESTRTARRRAWWRLALGLVIAAVAGLISLATYVAAGQEAAREAAQTGAGEGGYVVWWGGVAFGGWMALTATLRLWRLR